MSWLDGKLAAWDTETTGVDVTSARPVSYALVELVDGRLYSDYQLVNPGVPIPEETTAIHGVTDEMAGGGVPLISAVEKQAAKLVQWSWEGTPVVGMNISFDLTILDRLCTELLGVDLGGLGWHGPAIDCSVLDRAFGNPYRRGPRTLAALLDHHKVEATELHSAKGDAVATLRLVKRLGQKYKGIRVNSPSDLHRQQIEWRRQQMESLSEYRVGKGQPAIPEREYEWPIQGVRGVPAPGVAEA